MVCEGCSGLNCLWRITSKKEATPAFFTISEPLQIGKKLRPLSTTCKIAPFCHSCRKCSSGVIEKWTMFCEIRPTSGFPKHRPLKNHKWNKYFENEYLLRSEMSSWWRRPANERFCTSPDSSCGLTCTSTGCSTSVGSLQVSNWKYAHSRLLCSNLSQIQIKTKRTKTAPRSRAFSVRFFSSARPSLSSYSHPSII